MVWDQNVEESLSKEAQKGLCSLLTRVRVWMEGKKAEMDHEFANVEQNFGIAI